jgi:hypothetical protein
VVQETVMLFLRESRWYTLVAVVLQLPLTLLVLGVAAPFVRRGRRRPFAARLLLFSSLLLVWGMVGNAAWVTLARGRLYETFDPLVEWFPFILPGRWLLDEICGGHLMAGVSFADLTRLWFWLALGTWLLTIMTYRFIEPRTGGREGTILL